MSLLIPTKIMASDGEETIRQYRCAKLRSEQGFNSHAIVAVTNKRLVLYAEPQSKRAPMIQQEIYMDNIAGVSFFTGRPPKRRGALKALGVLFLLFALLSGIFYWQAGSLYNTLSMSAHMTKQHFLIAGTAAPMVLFLLILLVFLLTGKKHTMMVTVLTKALSESNINLKGSYSLDSNSFYVEPNLKETHRMFSELSSIILDIQSGNSLKYLSTEKDALDAIDIAV